MTCLESFLANNARRHPMLGVSDVQILSGDLSLPFSEVFSNVRVRERVGNQGIESDPAEIRGGLRGQTVGGNDPGFRRLAPPKTSENAIAFAIAFSQVVPAHGW